MDIFLCLFLMPSFGGGIKLVFFLFLTELGASRFRLWELDAITLGLCHFSAFPFRVFLCLWLFETYFCVAFLEDCRLSQITLVPLQTAGHSSGEQDALPFQSGCYCRWKCGHRE